jgi:hypothetical protein
MAWMLHNGRLPRKITEGVSMLVSFQPAVMREGQVHKGPDYYKSSESGHAPVIYKTRDGCKAYIVCHEGDLAEANQKTARPSTERWPATRTAACTSTKNRTLPCLVSGPCARPRWKSTANSIRNTRQPGDSEPPTWRGPAFEFALQPELLWLEWTHIGGGTTVTGIGIRSAGRQALTVAGPFLFEPRCLND